MNPNLIAESPKLMANLVASGLAKLPAKPVVARRYRGGTALTERVRVAVKRQPAMFRHTDLGLADVPPRAVRRALNYLVERGELVAKTTGTARNPSIYAKRTTRSHS